MEGWISTENLIHNLLKVEHRSKFLTKNCTAHLLSSSSFAAFTFFNWLSARLYGRSCLRRKSTQDQNLATEVEINLIKSPATPPSQWEALASCASAKIPWWGIFFKRLLLLESVPDIWLDAIWYGFRQTGCAMCAYHSEGRLVSKPAADSCIPITLFGGNDYVLLKKGLNEENLFSVGLCSVVPPGRHPLS